MKEEYKNGTMVWCQCIGWSTKKLYYEGPGIIKGKARRRVSVKNAVYYVYYVKLPFALKTGIASFEVREKDIKYVIE